MIFATGCGDYMRKGRIDIQEVAPRAGFEPATKRLTAACSTTELPRSEFKWCFFIAEKPWIC